MALLNSRRFLKHIAIISTKLLLLKFAIFVRITGAVMHKYLSKVFDLF